MLLTALLSCQITLVPPAPTTPESRRVATSSPAEVERAIVAAAHGSIVEIFALEGSSESREVALEKTRALVERLSARLHQTSSARVAALLESLGLYAGFRLGLTETAVTALRRVADHHARVREPDDKVHAAVSRRIDWFLQPRRPVPGRHALTTKDALRTIERTWRWLELAGDMDGDGSVDVVGQEEAWTHPIRVWRLDGSAVRTLWEPDDSTRRAGQAWGQRATDWRPPWVVGEDVDGDGVGDLLIGLPWEARGAALVVSGADGAPLRRHVGRSEDQQLGASVCFVGDVDGDGRADYALGSPAGGAAASFVTVHSGASGEELWRKEDRSGHGLGTHVAVAGDHDDDGIADLLAHANPRVSTRVLLLSGFDGRTIRSLTGRRGWIGPAGDLDGDGTVDLFVDSKDEHFVGKSGAVKVLSGKTFEEFATLDYPDFWDEYGLTKSVGDLDGDGHADLALGAPNFNIGNPGDSLGKRVRDSTALYTSTLASALTIESKPWCSFTYESGCAVVYSGRTSKPIAGMWGLPDSRDGLGLQVLPVPDENGDGGPELLVTDGRRAYVFEGPGLADRRER